MLYKKKYSKRKKKLLKILTVIFLLTVIIVILFETVSDPYQVKLIENCAKVIAEEAINETVYDLLQSEEYTYDDFATISYSDSNKVQAVSINSVNVNRFKSQINKAIQKRLKDEQYIEYNVPLGAFTGITVLSDFGPEIKINFLLSGSFNSKINSTFSSSGVNQTIHHIELTVTADIITTTPGLTKKITFDTNFEIAQTVIVGDIPNLYTGLGSFDIGSK